MEDECSPLDVIGQCWQAAVLQGFLTAAEVPAVPQAEGAAEGSEVLCEHSEGQSEQTQ